MALVDVSGDAIQLRLGRWERLGGLHGDVTVPRQAVRAVRRVEEPMKELEGVRAPGYGWPGRGAVGTWRGNGWKDFAVAYGGRPGVVIDLDPGSADGFRRLVVSVDDPDTLVAALSR